MANRLGNNAWLNQSPPEFDPHYYRAQNADLTHFSEAELANHYRIHGRVEGRSSSKFAFRENFIELCGEATSVLEIGPFCNPCLTGKRIRYFDILDQSGLEARATAIGYVKKKAPFIDFVSPNGSLDAVGTEFDAVFSSHCIEHQPDLINHLQEVTRILKPHGCYFLLIPNKKYCFDHFIAESTIASVVGSHVEKRKFHRIASVIEHRALTTHNDAARHWRDDHADPIYTTSIFDRTRLAIEEFNRSAGEYIDVHAWQFTPESFRKLIGGLNALAYIGLIPERVYETPFGRNEFSAILRKAG